MLSIGAQKIQENLNDIIREFASRVLWIHLHEEINPPILELMGLQLTQLKNSWEDYVDCGE